MSNHTRPEHAHPSAQYAPPVTPLANLAQGAEEASEALHNGDGDVTQPKMRAGELVALFLAQLTLFMALVVPSAFSLAIKFSAIDPGNKDTVLALAVGLAGTIVLFTNPIAGVLSDRTTSRFGRRRPWFLGGLILGTAGTALIGFSSSSVLVIVGWAIALTGYAMSNQTVLTYLGDRLPESQRGKVMGINGAITQVGPILGIVLAGLFSAQLGLMFLIPAAIAFLGGLWFTAVMKDTKYTGSIPAFQLASLTRGFYFNPRKHRNFGWVILSKLFIFASLAFTGIYGVYLLMSRLGLDTAGVASFAATMGLGSIVIAIGGAIGGGFLSDKLHSRRPFLIASSALLVISPLIVGTSTTTPQYVIGALIGSLGIGIYGSVDQALALDTLPSEENENGRYLSVFGLANAVPQAFGPLLAGVVLSLAGGDYTWVYFVAAAFAALGALAIIPITASRQSLVSTTSLQTTK